MRVTVSDFVSDPLKYIRMSSREKIQISEDGATIAVLNGPESEDDLFCKVSVGIPPGFADELMDSVTEAVDPMYPGYKRAFSLFPVKGTWIPLEGSDPYDGEIGKMTVADEMRVEFAVSRKDLGAAVAAIRKIHPYEEPGIDILPMIGWKSVIRP